jgi:hypothetical protein
MNHLRRPAGHHECDLRRPRPVVFSVGGNSKARGDSTAAPCRSQSVGTEETFVIPPHSPESRHESSLFAKWLLIAAAYVLFVGLGSTVIKELFLPSGSSFLLVVYFILLAPGLIPLLLGFRHLQRWVRFDEEHRKRHNIKHENRVVEFAHAHPYWTTAIIGIGGIFLVYALQALTAG